MHYYIAKDDKIISVISGPVDENDLALRGETLFSTDAVYESGWVRSGDIFRPPLVPLAQSISEAIAAVNQKHAEFLRTLTGNASVEERETWQAKALAAQAIQADTATPEQSQMIILEAQAVGETVEQLAQKILTKSAAYHKLVGLASGFRRKTEASILAASNADEIAQILAAAQEQATQLATQWASGG